MSFRGKPNYSKPKCFACGNPQCMKVELSETEHHWLCDYHLTIHLRSNK